MFELIPAEDLLFIIFRERLGLSSMIFEWFDSWWTAKFLSIPLVSAELFSEYEEMVWSQIMRGMCLFSMHCWLYDVVYL